MSELFTLSAPREVAPPRVGMAAHRKSPDGKDEWLTPPEIITALGEFDLDPCSPVSRPWPTASRHLTVLDDGFAQPWSGRVWMNPPYGSETGDWLCRLSEHGNGIALIFARTETAHWFEQVWPKAHAVFFFRGRLYFHHVCGRRAAANAGAPSALVAYGEENVDAISKSGLPGKLIHLK